MNSKAIIFVLLVCCFISCQTNNRCNNVILSGFTKELISLYINDPRNDNAEKRKDEIILITTTDTSYYYLYVFANNPKAYKFCREDYIGETSYANHSVKMFGNENHMFYSVYEIVRPKRCKYEYKEYDPNVWQICFNKNGSLNNIMTYKTTEEDDIIDIQELAEKYIPVYDH